MIATEGGTSERLDQDRDGMGRPAVEHTISCVSWGWDNVQRWRVAINLPDANHVAGAQGGMDSLKAFGPFAFIPGEDFTSLFHNLSGHVIAHYIPFDPLRCGADVSEQATT